jgi:hypothetical protein
LYIMTGVKARNIIHGLCTVLEAVKSQHIRPYIVTYVVYINIGSSQPYLLPACTITITSTYSLEIYGSAQPSGTNKKYMEVALIGIKREGGRSITILSKYLALSPSDGIHKPLSHKKCIPARVEGATRAAPGRGMTERRASLPCCCCCCCC